jgi:hypothetical protein
MRSDGVKLSTAVSENNDPSDLVIERIDPETGVSQIPNFRCKASFTRS